MIKAITIIACIFISPFILLRGSSHLILTKAKSIEEVKEFVSLYPKNRAGLNIFSINKMGSRRLSAVAYIAPGYEVILNQDLKVSYFGLKVEPFGFPSISINRIKKMKTRADGSTEIMFNGTVYLDSAKWDLLVQNRGNVDKIWSEIATRDRRALQMQKR